MEVTTAMLVIEGDDGLGLGIGAPAICESRRASSGREGTPS